MDLISGIASIFTGGLTGLIGAGITKFMEYKNKQLDYAHEVAMRQKDMELLDREIAGRVRVAEVEGASAEVVSANEALASSYGQDRATYAKDSNSAWFVIVDVVRGLIRPALTIYFVIFTTYIYWVVTNQLEEMHISFNTERAFQLYWYIILWVLYTAAVVVGWWFGTRSEVKAPKLGG